MINWDFTIEDCYRLRDEDKFEFDPRKSYELGGYRPLTESEGLDFPIEKFTEVGVNNMKTGKYSGLKKESRNFMLWWKEQYRLCNEGMTVDGYTVTGKHYFFLNFYTLNSYDQSGNKRIHPSFWEIHYQFFHYLNLCELLGYDVCALKARGVGWSEIAANIAVSSYTTKRGYQAIYTAFYESYLTGSQGILVDKCWPNLDWLNQKTETGMTHIRQKLDQTGAKKASTVDRSSGEENADSWGSIISSIVVDKPDKVRGARVNHVLNFKGHPGIIAGTCLEL